MGIDWQGLGRIAEDVLKAASEVAATKEITNIIQNWMALPLDSMEKEITHDVFSMSNQQLQIVDNLLRKAIENSAFNREELHLLLCVFAGFHGGWTLRIHVASKR